MLALLAFSIFLCVYLSAKMLLHAKRFHLLDAPNDSRKHQSSAIPTIGGVSVFLTVTIVSIIGLSLDDGFTLDFSYILMWAVPCCAMFIIGIFDDVLNLSPLTKLSGQLISATIAATSAYFLDIRSEITQSNAMNFFISVGWIIFVTNAFNFVDNHDGVATIYAATVFIAMAVIALDTNQYLVISLSLVHFGALIGFLRLNLPDARAYLGDSGSLFLGTSMGVLSLRIDTSASSGFISALLILVLFSFLVADTSLALFARIKGKRKIYHGGRDHISHRLQILGYNKRATLSLISGGCITSFVVAVGINHLNLELSLAVLAVYSVLFVTLVIKLSSIAINYE